MMKGRFSHNWGIDSESNPTQRMVLLTKSTIDPNPVTTPLGKKKIDSESDPAMNGALNQIHRRSQSYHQWKLVRLALYQHFEIVFGSELNPI